MHAAAAPGTFFIILKFYVFFFHFLRNNTRVVYVCETCYKVLIRRVSSTHLASVVVVVVYGIVYDAIKVQAYTFDARQCTGRTVALPNKLTFE